MLRKPNSIPKSDTVITDPVLEPFFVTKSSAGGSYTVFERVVKGENDTEYIKTICYPSTFSNALRAIAKEMLDNGEKTHYSTVKEYVERWNNIQKKIDNVVGF